MRRAWLVFALFCISMRTLIYAQAEFGITPSSEASSAATFGGGEDSSSTNNKLQNALSYFEKQGYSCAAPSEAIDPKTFSGTIMVIWAINEMGIVAVRRLCPPEGVKDETMGTNMSKWKWQKYVRMVTNNTGMQSGSRNGTCYQENDASDRPLDSAYDAQYWCTKSKSNVAPTVSESGLSKSASSASSSSN